MFDLNKIVRENIKKLVPYSSARSEYEGKQGVFLDANENAFGSPLNENYNRYPDPLQKELKTKLSEIKKVFPENIFLGNGSDEAIDILFRVFCNPSKDNIILCPPTYGMYEVAANINDIEVLKIPLLADSFQLNVAEILKNCNENTKLIFICCPNNPTGNGVSWKSIKIILEKFEGIVLIDEAYIDFASYPSLLSELVNYPNLVVLQTFSKAFGMAGLRVGMAFASEEIIKLFNKIKSPYNINTISQKLALDALNNVAQINKWIKEIIAERENLISELTKFRFVLKIYPSEANFILMKMLDPKKVFDYLMEHQIIVRNRSKEVLCEGCLRITVGTKSENKKLLEALNQLKK